MDPNQAKLILGILLVLVVVSFFFKVTRKLAVWGILFVVGLSIGFLSGVGITKEHIKKKNPVCHDVIFSKQK